MAGNHDHYDSKSDPISPLHLWFFLCIFLMFLGMSWFKFESMLESALDQIKLVLMISPLLLLLVVHWHSTFDDRRRGGGGGIWNFIPFADDRDSLHRSGSGGGTPWGIGLLLVFLFFMISYHSSFREKWFPLLSRS